MRKATSSSTVTASQGVPANADGAPVPRSRNAAGTSSSSASGGKKQGASSAGSNQTPAVSSAQQQQNQTSSTNNDNDTFNKHYNKELRVSKDEIPIVMAELNDSAYRFIKREQYERALNLLQKAYGIMDVIDFKACRRDKFHLFIMFHNMALCYQKMQMLEECASCIDQALDNLPIEMLSLEEKSISNRMRKLVIISRLKMQFCAILSQIHRHKDALEQAREGVRLGHLLINDLRELCLFYIRREDIGNQGRSANNFYSVDMYEQQKEEKKGHSSGHQRKSVGAAMASNAGLRNRSFSSFLSQQEAYGAFESLQGIGATNEKGNLSRHSSGMQSSHNLSSFYSVNQLESSMSYIEKTARKLFPILNELKKRMVPEKKRTSSSTSQANRRKGVHPRKHGANSSVVTLDQVEDDLESDSDQLFVDLTSERQGSAKQATDMKNILGYLNQGEWTSKLSIGSIMQLQPYKIKDLIEQGQNELELTRESFIQKVSALSVAYFCYSTEIRFIIQMKEDLTFDTPSKQKESEFWHAKSLELACTFLPGECPLLNHINLSYQKHFAPVKTTILEDTQQEDDLQVIKPLNGVDNTKVQPIIRKLNNVQVAITPYQLTPINQVTKQVISQMITFNEYQEMNQGNAQGAVGQNILPASLLQMKNSAHSQSMVASSGEPVLTTDAAARKSHNAKHNLSVVSSAQYESNITREVKAGGARDESLVEIDSLLNDLQMSSRKRSDEMSKVDMILHKLIESKKITKKQLIQKLMSVSDSVEANEGHSPHEEGPGENIVDDGSDGDTTTRLPKNGSQRAQASNTNQNFYKFASQEQLTSLKNERPKSSKGGARSSIKSTAQGSSNAMHQRSQASVKTATHLGQKSQAMERGDIHSAKDMAGVPSQHGVFTMSNSRQGKRGENASQHVGHGMGSSEPSKSKVQSTKSKKDMRPLSGGIQKAVKQNEGRSRIQQQQHAMSMYDKIGQAQKSQQSPPGPIDFQSKHHQVQQLNQLKQVSKMSHNQSFDSIPVQNQLGQLPASKLKPQVGIPSQSASQLKQPTAQSHLQQHHQNQSHVNSMSAAQQAAAQNPQAYDELKKRLLNEYKKLVNNKKSGVSVPAGSNSGQTHHDDVVHSMPSHKAQASTNSSKTANKKHSNRIGAGGASSSGVNGHDIAQSHLGLMQNTSGQGLIDPNMGPGQNASPKTQGAAHLNVYKPTFIINNSFQNEVQQNQDDLTRPHTNDHKKFTRPPKSSQSQVPAGSQGPIVSSSQQMGPSMVSQGIHISKQGASGAGAMSSQSRLKKNSAIERASSSVQNISSSKHGISAQSKVSSKMAQEQSKHMLQQRELSQQYLAENKPGSSSLSKHSLSYNSGHQYMQHHHQSQMLTTASGVDMSHARGADSGYAGQSSQSYLASHQAAMAAATKGSSSGSRRQASSNHGVIAHHSLVGSHAAGPAQPSRSSNAMAYEKMKKKLAQRS